MGQLIEWILMFVLFFAYWRKIRKGTTWSSASIHIQWTACCHISIWCGFRMVWGKACEQCKSIHNDPWSFSEFLCATSAPTQQPLHISSITKTFPWLIYESHQFWFIYHFCYELACNIISNNKNKSKLLIWIDNTQIYTEWLKIKW